MWDGLWSGVDRRRFRRLPAFLTIEIGVEIYGFHGSVTPFFSSGVTADISRGGLRAYLDAPIHRGSLCNVFFRDAGEQVRPCRATGKVVRCTETADGFEVAVEFDEPLLNLRAEQPTEAAAHR